MATEFRSYDVTTPAGTAQASPLTTAMTFPVRKIDSIEIRVPPGPRGELGFRIATKGVQVWPITPGAWIATDDEVVTIPVDDAPTSGDWELTTYNTGIYPHTVTVRFFVDPVGAPSSTPTPTIPASQLSGITVAGSGGAPVPGSTVAVTPFTPPAPIPTSAVNSAVPAIPGPTFPNPPS